jgi:nucleotide-binding universal stress UspA family protein
MMRRILFATDGSPSDAAARQSAVNLARRFEAKIAALGIVDAPWITHGEAVPLGAMAYKHASEEEQLQSGHKRVHAALEELRVAKIAETTAEIEGDPARLIAEEASAHDIVVIGRATRFHLGSGEGVSPLLKELVRVTPRPVLAVGDKPATGARVLVAFDGSAAAARAMHLAALLGLTAKSEVQVLSIDDDAPTAQERAARAASLLRTHGATLASSGISSAADPADVILDQLRRFEADTIVMGAYGHHGLREAIFGSCTRRLLADCAASLFLQH